MWITDGKETQEKQNILYINKKLSTPDAAGLLKSNQDQKSVPEKTNSSKTENGVKLDLSKQAIDMYQRQLEAQKDSAKAAGKSMRDVSKLMEIARRIARGDKVPPKDEKKLAEYNFKLYQIAKMSAVMNQNKKHKKHKSLFKEEDRDKKEKLRALENGISPETAESSGADSGSGEAGGEDMADE